MHCPVEGGGGRKFFVEIDISYLEKKDMEHGDNCPQLLELGLLTSVSPYSTALHDVATRGSTERRHAQYHLSCSVVKKYD
jgi:hypothetical protein